MNLPVNPPVAPMLAKLSRELPRSGSVINEPKWDGFRCVVFRDGDAIELGSRNERPLDRYFPELVAELRARLPERCVVDGEIVVATGEGLDFDALQARIHPAASRVRMLAEATPASFVAFDLLAIGDEDLTGRPFSERRARLVEVLGGCGAPVHVTPATSDPDVAADWFARFGGAGLDGVVVKAESLPYQQDKRVMVKVKHERTADCVVGGFRWHKSGGKVGSLLLGLYDTVGRLQHVGVTSSFTDARRIELLGELEAYRAPGSSGHPWSSESDPAGEGSLPTGRVPGTPSRWSAGKDLSFEPLRPELVCEVAYDHLQGDRFRHATTFRRWRPERDPASCGFEQLETVTPALLSELFGLAPG
jgi:ATP-dependent DNA ligase